MEKKNPNKKCDFPFDFRFISAIGIALFAILVVLLILGVPAATQVSGIQAQLNNGENAILADQDPVVFNALVNDQSPTIDYNTTTGDFTITKAGTYAISWWVVTDGSSEFTNMNFSIAIGGTPYSMGTSPIVSGQVSGFELITVGSVPATISLVNNSGNDILIANTPVQANIVILE